MIKLNLKGLAKFMTASAAGQRKVLQQYKFPDDEGQVIAKYYRDTRDTIARYHEQKHPESWLLDKASDLLFDAKNAPKPQIPSRLKNNARALKFYAEHFLSALYDVLPDVNRAQY